MPDVVWEMAKKKASVNFTQLSLGWDVQLLFFSKCEKFRKVGDFSCQLLGDMCELAGID